MHRELSVLYFGAEVTAFQLSGKRRNPDRKGVYRDA